MPDRRALTPPQALALLAAHIAEMGGEAEGRIAIGLAGGPGAGKSTLAAELVVMLNAVRPGGAALVPMDGFHMRHARLEALGLVEAKGAPHTFEGAAFVDFIARLKRAGEAVRAPGYSRRIEDVVDDAIAIAPEARVLVVEGNYLLLPEPPWAGVRPLLDFAVYLDVPRETVRARLLARHAEEGLFTEARNRAHVERTDLPNYDRVALSRDRADLVITMLTEG